MKFKEFTFIYISRDYMRKMHDVESEIFFVDTEQYEKKPHLGILTSINGQKYVIPLTSAKDKHRTWDDVTATNYILYEIINTEITPIDDEDIIVDIKNIDVLKKKGIIPEEYHKYKKRLLSVLEIKKMFPIKNGVYTHVDFKQDQTLGLEENQRRGLMYKEYRFCLNIRDDVEKKAKKIYENQIKKGKVLKYHCDYKKLEEACNQYIVENSEK